MLANSELPSDLELVDKVEVLASDEAEAPRRHIRVGEPVEKS
jgi:hypothetical protein